MVGVGNVVGARRIMVLAGCDCAWRSAAAPVMVDESQREQAEVGFVAHVQEVLAGVVCLGGALLVRRRLLVAVDAAAQQLLVFRRCIVFAAQKGNSYVLHFLYAFKSSTG